jgi:hypothetical protein
MTTFRAVVEKDGLNPFVEVPARVSRAFAAFADRGRIRVAGTIEGHPLHATLVPKRGRAHRVYVNGGMRAATGIEVGDRVLLKLRPLGNAVDLPADMARALARAGLRRAFDALAPSHRRELVRSVEDARSPRNRVARIERTLAHLRGERTQQPRPAVVDKPLWTCPRCGNPFVTRNMRHSCARHDLDALFRGRPPAVRALFERFRAMVDERGPTTTIVYRDRVAFMVKVRFAGVTPRRDGLDLGFWFTERDEDSRFSRIETIATNAHVHRARIRTLGELDHTVSNWIDRAYRVGCREHLRGTSG